MPLIYRRLIFCLFNSGREKERVLIQCQLRCCLCVLLSGDFMSPVRNSLCLGELGGLTFGHCFSKSSIMSAATCIREMRDFAILWAILGCILGLCACGQSFHCLFLQEKKRERYPCWLYPFLKEKERESCYPCWLYPFLQEQERCYPRGLYPPCAKGGDLSSSSCFASSVSRLSCLASLT